MVDDGIYYFSSYRAECDVMIWQDILKIEEEDKKEKEKVKKAA